MLKPVAALLVLFVLLSACAFSAPTPVVTLTPSPAPMPTQTSVAVEQATPIPVQALEACQEQYDEAMTLADAAKQMEQLQQAISCYDPILSGDPSNPSLQQDLNLLVAALLELSALHVRADKGDLGEIQTALRRLKEAGQRYPHPALAEQSAQLHQLISALHGAERLLAATADAQLPADAAAEALAAIELALALEPTLHPAWINDLQASTLLHRADQAAQSGDLPAAYAYCGEALELASHDSAFAERAAACRSAYMPPTPTPPISRPLQVTAAITQQNRDSTEACSDQFASEIWGRVEYRGGDPGISGATIRIATSLGDWDTERTTDANGQFHFYNLGCTTYDLTLISLPNVNRRNLAQQRVNEITGRPSANAVVIFTVTR